jgi:hypothetical protein
MALQDLTSRQNVLELIKLMPEENRITAWAASNPPLAMEAELWEKEPKRAARFTVDTVTEAISFIERTETLDALYESDKRAKVSEAASDRIYRLQRIQQMRLAGTPLVTSYPGSGGLGKMTAEATLAELNDVPLNQAAYKITAQGYRLDEHAIETWVHGLSPDTFRELLGERNTTKQPAVLEEMLNRGMLNEVFASDAANLTLATVLSKRMEADANVARHFIARRVEPAVYPKMRWTPEGLEVLKANRRYSDLLYMRMMSMQEIVEHAHGLTMEEIDRLLAFHPTCQELLMLEGDVLALAAKGERLSNTIVLNFDKAVGMSEELTRVILLNSDSRVVVTALRLMDETQQRSFLADFRSLRDEDGKQLLHAVGQESESAENIALMWLLLEYVPNPLMRNINSHWLGRAMVSRVCTELETSDWKTFFTLVQDFSGTVDELLQTIKALR